MQISLLLRFSVLLLMIVSLCSCAPEVQPEVKHPPQPKKVSAAEYLLNLSLAKFELDEGASYDDIKPQTEVIENFGKANAENIKKKDAGQSLTVVIIEFKRKDNNKSRLLTVPLQGVDGESEQFLKQATDQMRDKGFVIVSVKVANIELPKERRATSRNREGRDVYAKVSSNLEGVLKSQKSISMLEEAKLFIHLCDFFMDARFRDAAYITMENAKQALALASEKQDADKETINLLVKRINDMEVELHKNMPFSI